MSWGPTTPAIAFARARGRARRLALLRLHRQMRLARLAELLKAEGGLLRYGAAKRFAEVLRVSKSTIARDLRALLAEETSS